METPKLNKAQQEAVAYNGGPLLIVAGAGTGKTTVITEKILHLVESGQAKPEEILALTFTDKAAEEMHDRVDVRLNAGYVDLSISTFHAFCERLLEEYGMEIGLPNRFKLATDTDACVLLREKIFDLPLNYYRPLGNPGRHIYELLRHFSKCKDELITPDEYLAYAEGAMLDRDETGEIEKNRLTEVAQLYHAYNQLLLDHSMLDFGDLIFYAIKLLRERPNILKRLQARYRFVLVDEFQDVNWAQYELTKLLSSDGNLTVVGDDDQAIYAFRGASVSNILRFKEDFPQAKEVVLTENFRSGRGILDVSYKSVQHNNPDRLEVKLKIDKRLTSSKKEPGAITHIHESTLDAEVAAVVKEILRLRESDPGLVWDDIAILVRANSHAEPFLRSLEAHGVPYEFLASSGLYRQPIVLDCMAFLTALADRFNSKAITRLLYAPGIDLAYDDVQKIVHFADRKSISCYEALRRIPELKPSESAAQKSAKLLEFLSAGGDEARAEKPTAVLYHFMEKSGYLEYLTHQEQKGDRQAIRSIYHLKQFFDLLARFEEVVPGARVAQFVEHMENLLDAGSEGKLYQPSDTPDSVNVMTIHGAKGLEFRHVFVVNLVEDRFPSRRRGEAIEIPLELIKEKLPEGDYHVEEERRLFYVAMTRAKERLYFTSASDYGGARTKKISRFLAELDYGNSEKEKAEKKSVVSILDKPQKQADPHGFVYEMPTTFSFSQIRSYETCPYQYKLAHVLSIPMRGNASFSFGTTIHSTLQHFYERVQELNAVKQTSLFASPEPARKEGEIRVPTLEELLKLYDEYWLPDWYESKPQREEYHRKGREILQTFYAAQEGNWTVPAALESGFRVRIGDVTLRGKIDRIDQLPDKTIEIVDYKTGKSKETLTSDDKEQLLMYQIAVENMPQYQQLGRPAKLTFYYVNDDVRTSFIGTGPELEKLKEKILATVASIRGGDFTATPGPHVCGRCDFREICEFRIL